MAAVVREASLSEAPLSVDRMLSLVQDAEVGGVGLFVGTVRRHDPAPSTGLEPGTPTAEDDEGAEVLALDYLAHPTAGEILSRVADTVARGHDVLSVAVQHRIGHLVVGDLAVVVAVGAVHRGPALAACRELIDTVKAEVPIWKEQRFRSGRSEWVGLPPSPTDGDTG